MQPRWLGLTPALLLLRINVARTPGHVITLLAAVGIDTRRNKRNKRLVRGHTAQVFPYQFRPEGRHYIGRPQYLRGRVLLKRRGKLHQFLCQISTVAKTKLLRCELALLSVPPGLNTLFINQPHIGKNLLDNTIEVLHAGFGQRNIDTKHCLTLHIQALTGAQAIGPACALKRR